MTTTVEALIEAANERLTSAECELAKAAEGANAEHHLWIAVAHATSAGLLIEAAARKMGAGGDTLAH